jgi:hypothetical protein
MVRLEGSEPPALRSGAVLYPSPAVPCRPRSSLPVYESRDPHPCSSRSVPACTWESVTISVTNAMRHPILGRNRHRLPQSRVSVVMCLSAGVFDGHAQVANR